MNGLRFVDSITDFFKSPKWLMNLLLGGICVLIPIVGAIVLMGWHVTIFYGRSRREVGETDYWRLTPAQWPEFDFGKFVIYLQRGLWPFLVALVAGFALIPVAVLCFLPVLLASNMSHEPEASEALTTAAVVISVGLWMVIALLAQLLIGPFVLRANALQNFKAALSFQWVRDFIGRMWKEMGLAFLFGIASGIVFGLGGYLLLCVGIYFTIGLAMFSAAHLQRQLLDLYVQRGGEPLTPAPSLLDQPTPAPPFPASPPPPLPPASISG